MPYQSVLKRPDLKGNFSCNVCLKTFCHSSSLSRHRMTAHFKNYVCIQCNMEVFNNESLRSHMLNKHDIKRFFMCRCCNWAFPDKTTLHYHTAMIAVSGKPDDQAVLARSCAEGDDAATSPQSPPAAIVTDEPIEDPKSPVKNPNPAPVNTPTPPAVASFTPNPTPAPAQVQMVFGQFEQPQSPSGYSSIFPALNTPPQIPAFQIPPANVNPAFLGNLKLFWPEFVKNNPVMADLYLKQLYGVSPGVLADLAFKQSSTTNTNTGASVFDECPVSPKISKAGDGSEMIHVAGDPRTASAAPTDSESRKNKRKSRKPQHVLVTEASLPVELDANHNSTTESVASDHVDSPRPASHATTASSSTTDTSSSSEPTLDPSAYERELKALAKKILEAAETPGVNVRQLLTLMCHAALYHIK